MRPCFMCTLHTAGIPCGVYYVAPSSIHTSDHVYNFTAARHGLLGEGKGDASTEAEDVYHAVLRMAFTNGNIEGVVTSNLPMT